MDLGGGFKNAVSTVLNVKELKEAQQQVELQSRTLSPKNPPLMLELMISEVNNVLEKHVERRSGENESIVLPNGERNLTLKHVVPFSLFPTVLIDLSLHVHSQRD